MNDKGVCRTAPASPGLVTNDEPSQVAVPVDSPTCHYVSINIFNILGLRPLGFYLYIQEEEEKHVYINVLPNFPMNKALHWMG